MSEPVPSHEYMRSLCAVLRARTYSIVRIGFGVTIGSLLLMPLNPLIVMILAVVFFFLAGALALLLTAIRVAIVAVVFARISLAQLLGFSLVMGVLLSFSALLPDDIKAAPIFILSGIVIYIGYTISQQDPTGENIAPVFFQEAVSAQAREREAAGGEK